MVFVIFAFFEVIFTVFLLESLYAPCGIDEFPLPGIKRMAHRANLSVNFLNCAAGLEGITTAAVNYGLFVFGMYIFFHTYYSSKSKNLILPH